MHTDRQKLPPKTDPRQRGGRFSPEILISYEKLEPQPNLRYLLPTIEEMELKQEGKMWMSMALVCCWERS